MSLTKRQYTAGETIITAENLNAIQDEVIAHGTKVEQLEDAKHTHTNKNLLDSLTGLKTVNGQSLIGAGNLDVNPTSSSIANALGYTPADNEDLTSEATARAAADEELKSDITAEETARANADAALTTDVNRIDRRLSALWKLNEGVVYDTEEQSERGLNEPVTGAKYGSIESIYGESFVWNQIVDKTKITASKTANGITFTNNGDGSIKISGTATARAEFVVSSKSTNKSIEAIAGHFYFLLGGVSNAAKLIWTRDGDNGNGTIITGSTQTALFYTIQSGIEIDTTVTPRLFDLTKMFGSGNEPTTTDDYRIKMIEAYAAEHPEYNEGEILDSFNPVVTVTDTDETVLTTITLPYTLRGVNDIHDEIIVHDDGTAELVKRLGTVDLGTLNYTRPSGASSPSGRIFKTESQIAKPRQKDAVNNLVSAIYTSKSSYWFTSSVDNMGIMVYEDGRVLIRNDTYDDDAASFKTAMSGVMLTYELAEPVTTDITDELSALLDVPVDNRITIVDQNGNDVSYLMEYIVKLSEVT